MARYKYIDTTPRFLAVDLAQQLLPLKVVRFAYSQGIVSSRGIERACREHVPFLARSGDTRPHCTTIAHFVSTLGDDIARVVAAVVAICDSEVCT